MKATFERGLKNMQNLSGENIRKWWHYKQRNRINKEVKGSTTSIQAVERNKIR